MKTAIQILLVLPATLMAPVGWYFVLFGYIPEARYGGSASIYFTKAAIFILASGIELVALWNSIFLTGATRAARANRAMVFGLIVSLVFNAFFLVGLIFSPHRTDLPVVIAGTWILGGPFVVGIWNLMGICKRQ